MSFETPIYIMLHLAGFSFFMAMVISGFMIFAGILDWPDARSNHRNAMPTGGGLGLAAGFGSGLLALTLFYPQIAGQGRLGQFAALAFGVSFLGLLDDMYETDSKTKFFIMMILAIACVYVTGAPKTVPFAGMHFALPQWISIGGAILWVFVVTNTVNFMDGINGFMNAVMLLAFAALATVSITVGAVTPAILSVLMVGALAGFLPYNMREQALIFCGDTGSLLIGFIFAACSLLLVVDAPQMGLLYVGPLLILPFLTDVLLTMLLRAKRREKLLTPHTHHLYQRLVRFGYSHMSVTMMYLAAGISVSIISLFGIHNGMIGSIFFFAIWVNVMSLIYMALGKKMPLNAHGQQQMLPDQ